MTRALLDDHLLRDLLAGDLSAELQELVGTHELATTNLYLFRLCKSVVAAPGGALTGGWSPAQRRALGERLVALPNDITVVPLSTIAFRMAELSAAHRLSTLGAEAVAAAENLAAALCVWDGDDGPGIRHATASVGASYRTIHR